MDSEVRNATMVGVILMALAAVIMLSFMVFSIVKGTTNEGVVQHQSSITAFQDSQYDDFNDTKVKGRDVLSFMSRNDELSILLNTKKMRVDNSLSFDKDLYVQFMDDKAYVNYGTILTLDGGSTELHLIEHDDKLEKFDNTLTLKDGVVISNGAYLLNENGMLVQNNEIRDCRIDSKVVYVDENSNFDAHLIKDVTGTIIGVLFTQLEV